MRRIFGAVLIGLGAFGLVLAVLLPTVVVPGSKKIPLDLNITLHSTGTAKLFDPATNTYTRTVWVEPRTGVIVKGMEHQVQALVSGQVALDTTLTFDAKAIDF